MAKINNKRGLEMSFAWIFAIVVGAVIIFLAIYSTTRLIDTEKTTQNTEIGKEIGILLTPVETNLESGKAAIIKMPVETRIFNECKKLQGEVFGKQDISVSTKSNIGKEWESSGIASSFQNKYIFSGDVIEGKEFRIFTKPFEMPFKIADLTFIWSSNEEYCFINPTREIERDILDLELQGMEIVEDISLCSVNSKKVCFTRSGCDIDVDVNSQSVKKKKRTESVFYEDELIFGAILSDLENYECQVKRLMARDSELSSITISKSLFLSSKGCGSERLQPLLGSLSNKTLEIKSSLELREISNLAENIRRENDNLGCRLF